MKAIESSKYFPMLLRLKSPQWLPEQKCDFCKSCHKLYIAVDCLIAGGAGGVEIYQTKVIKSTANWLIIPYAIGLCS